MQDRDRGHTQEVYGSIQTTLQDRLAQREQRFGIVPADQLTTPEARKRQYANLEAMVGNTPLTRVDAGNGNTLWVKIESENPTESHYDRVSLLVLKTLEEEGLIKPGNKILEGTSGSAGRSFAYFCNRLGYQLDMIVPHEDEFPEARARDIKGLGANLIHAGEKGGIAKVTSMYKRMLVGLRREGFTRHEYELEGKPIMVFKRGDETICAPNHSEIEITPRAFGTIAQEVIGQLPAGTKIDTFIGTLGNGATVKGISEVLRATYDDVQIIGTEFQAAPTNAIRKLRAEVGEENLRAAFELKYGFPMPERGTQTYHDSFGSSTPGYEPPFVEVAKIDDIVVVGNEWRDYKRRQNTYAWYNSNPVNSIGNTSAENAFVALKLSEFSGWRDRNILVLAYDKGDQYPDWPPELRIYEYPVQPQEDSVPYCVVNFRNQTA